ncbi:XamI family restriction endonuclease [Streptomyces sp. NPDC050418]|uniref:XamI family restriction endonuclease n=1 Tax=Streptomyces sp. NPDC050418 TaxID=3365612 RepID=UPI0037B1C12D
MVRAWQLPQNWTERQLIEGRAHSEELFRQERKEEGPRAFEGVYAEVEPRVREALELTDDLLNLTGQVFIFDSSLWKVLRYFCAPPVSEEDLWTLVGQKFSNRIPEVLADDTAEVIREVLDPVRFSWARERRKPTETERESAVMATSALLALELLRTRRRGDASKRQEAEVAQALENIGYSLDPRRDDIDVLDVLTRRSFSRERKVAGAKCDVPIRIADGRLLAVECKVSNGPKNSWKRLIRECGGKSETWRQHFGTQVMTVAVLAGSFDLSCLERAQNMDGLWVFWQHDLDPLMEFINSIHSR